MRYLLAILVPPLAVLLCNRPVQAVLNFVLWMLCLIPGIGHGLLVVGQTIQEERQAELISAVSGQPVRRKSAEWSFVLALMMMAVIGGGVISLAAWIMPERVGVPALFSRPPVAVSDSTSKPETLPWQAPPILGWTMAEVASRHGKPLSLDKATAVAVWPEFQATFQNGVVMNVDPPAQP